MKAMETRDDTNFSTISRILLSSLNDFPDRGERNSPISGTSVFSLLVKLPPNRVYVHQRFGPVTNSNLGKSCNLRDRVTSFCPFIASLPANFDRLSRPFGQRVNSNYHSVFRFIETSLSYRAVAVRINRFAYQEA